MVNSEWVTENIHQDIRKTLFQSSGLFKNHCF